MNLISKEALEFLKEAKEHLTSDPELFTYRNQEEGFIALRSGFRDDCIMVYELGSPIGNFTEQLPKRHKVLIDYDELEKYKKLKDGLLTQIENVEGILEFSGVAKCADYNKGYLKALTEVLSLLK